LISNPGNGGLDHRVDDPTYTVIPDILVFLRAFLAAAEPRWATLLRAPHWRMRAHFFFVNQPHFR